MSSLIGHIRNQKATRAGARAAFAHEAAISRSPKGFAALDEALAEMRAAGVRRIVIEGGDGTVREAIGRALPLWGEAPVEFAILASGNTNLIARSGGRVSAAAAARLADMSAPVRRRVIPLLKVEREGERPLMGFIMGAGAYATATKMAREEIGARHGAQVALAVLRLLRSPRLRAPSPIGFAPDGRATEVEPRLLVAVTSLPGALLYGLSPFWGSGTGALRWLDIAANPPRLALAAPFIAFGAPRRWMRAHYRSGRSRTAELQIDAPFVMDGEHFEPGPGGRLRLSAEQTVTFVSV